MRVEGALTFLPLDEPARVAEEIVAAFYAADGSSAAGIAPTGIEPGKRLTESAS